MKKVLSFLSDFGIKDSYVAQVKARIISGVPNVSIIDITHECEPYDIVSGAWLLNSAWRSFPVNTVHLAVVDPEVGTNRAILALEKDGHFFIGPDNGLFSFIYPAEKAFEITWRPKDGISPTFHARDIMAGAAAMILSGIQPEALGSHIEKTVSFDVCLPMIVHIDRFGNVITNIHSEEGLPDEIVVNGCRISRTADSFCQIEQNETAMIKGSSGTIEIVAYRKSAARMLRAKTGMPVAVKKMG